MFWIYDKDNIIMLISFVLLVLFLIFSSLSVHLMNKKEYLTNIKFEIFMITMGVWGILVNLYFIYNIFGTKTITITNNDPQLVIIGIYFIICALLIYYGNELLKYSDKDTDDENIKEEIKNKFNIAIPVLSVFNTICLLLIIYFIYSNKIKGKTGQLDQKSKLDPSGQTRSTHTKEGEQTFTEAANNKKTTGFDLGLGSLFKKN